MKGCIRLTALRFAAALLLLLVVPSVLFSGLLLIRSAPSDREESSGDYPTLGDAGEGKEWVVILDAGHGGMDSGAVGTRGTLEKDLNLLQTLALAEQLRAVGVKTILTRDEDVMLDSAVSGGKKMKDLSARLGVMRENPDALFVSIHMNRFPSASCRGTQVWYAGASAEARVLADAISNEVKKALQPENSRLSKQADESIFLLHRASGCAVLVECGFLSCPEEEELLLDAAYRDRMAAGIMRGILRVLDARERGNE